MLLKHSRSCRCPCQLSESFADTDCVNTAPCVWGLSRHTYLTKMSSFYRCLEEFIFASEDKLRHDPRRATACGGSLVGRSSTLLKRPAETFRAEPRACFLSQGQRRSRSSAAVLHSVIEDNPF